MSRIINFLAWSSTFNAPSISSLSLRFASSTITSLKTEATDDGVKGDPGSKGKALSDSTVTASRALQPHTTPILACSTGIKMMKELMRLEKEVLQEYYRAMPSGPSQLGNIFISATHSNSIINKKNWNKCNDHQHYQEQQQQQQQQPAFYFVYVTLTTQAPCISVHPPVQKTKMLPNF